MLNLSKTDTGKLLKLLSDCSVIIRKRSITTREIDKARQLNVMINKLIKDKLNR
jgi:hypothetical protein